MNGHNHNGNHEKPVIPHPKKYKFLFVSIEGLIGDLAWQLIKEGHEAKYSIEQKSEKNVFDGFVPKSEDWKKDVDWADVIIFDDIGFGKEADDLRKKGKKVIGCSSYTDKLEDERDFGQEELKSVGVAVLPHWNFESFDAAVDFIKKNPGRYVIKPNGKAQGEKELSFVGQEEDGSDLIQILERYKKKWGKAIKSFQIQKFAPGVEIAVGVFFNGKEFITPICVNFEHKKMFPGDVGPNTGEMGTSMYWGPANRIFNETFEKMKAKLAASGYCGYLDLNCIANWRGVFPLEWTCRFGVPTIQIQMEGVTSPWGEFLHALASGEKYELKTKRGFEIGVVIATPPFPFKDPSAFRKYSEDAAIIFKKPVTEGVHIGDVKLDEGEWRLAGESGYALVVTGFGSTMEEARKSAYKRVKNIQIPNMFYRTDIGVRWYTDSDRLQTWGYLF
ncbi:phosphoribosylamine--glycine ligase [Candidatus Micrarchaeota archaeon]|nr:phosphoribosylamine--glycine ligase [Candidatus Micrarchaeota archaeon]